MSAPARAEVEAAANELCASFSGAWRYLHLLEGMHEGAKAFPEAEVRFRWALQELYRAVFDAFFAKAGTIMDRTKGTKSLPSFITLVRRHFGNELSQELSEVEVRLAKRNGSLAKLRAWRHEAVAHRVESGGVEAFQSTNKMHLAEVRNALHELEGLFNLITLNSLGVHNETESGASVLRTEAQQILSVLAAAPASPG